eukprot:6185301-Pleurochrysis_carterae.AAC.2
MLAMCGQETAPVVFLMATHGEGEPTDNAVAFYKAMNCDLQAGLMSQQYDQFCSMGKWIDAKMADLGAQVRSLRGSCSRRLHAIRDGDGLAEQLKFNVLAVVCSCVSCCLLICFSGVLMHVCAC